MSKDLPCITVGEAIAALSKLHPDAKLHAWMPGSYLPVACVMTCQVDGGRALMEVNLPSDSALGRMLDQ